MPLNHSAATIAAHLLMNSTAEGAEEHVMLVKNVVMVIAQR
jgi:hypothetical protein